VNGNTSKPVYPTAKSHVNYVVADTESWEQLCAKALEEMEEVEAYVKNEFLGFTIPYVSEDQERRYFPDFIARCKTSGGGRINLIIEITGANKKDKATKKYYVDKLWLPAVNAVRDKYGYDEWRFVEVAEDIRFLKNKIMAAIQKQRV
jgi:type III restriction enzyme